jgi:hypothetical protein
MSKVRELIERLRRWLGAGAIPAAALVAAAGAAHAEKNCPIWENNKSIAMSCSLTVMVCGGPPVYLGGHPTCHYERKVSACPSGDRATCDVVRP